MESVPGSVAAPVSGKPPAEAITAGDEDRPSAVTANVPLNPGGSFLRDRMANERTLLAWIRTALTLIALGLALAKLAAFLQISMATYEVPADLLVLLPEPRLSQQVAAALILLGGLIAAVGGHRSWRYARIIDPIGRAPSDRVLMAFAAATALMSVALLLYILSRG